MGVSSWCKEENARPSETLRLEMAEGLSSFLTIMADNMRHTRLRQEFNTRVQAKHDSMADLIGMSAPTTPTRSVTTDCR
jgi:hypothetical protein